MGTNGKKGDKQGQTGTYRDKWRQTGMNRDKHGEPRQIMSNWDEQGHMVKFDYRKAYHGIHSLNNNKGKKCKFT